MNDRSPIIRKLVLVGLGYTKSAQALEPLLKASHHEDEELRDTAAFALGQLATPPAKARLRELAASDPSRKVRDTAALYSQ